MNYTEALREVSKTTTNPTNMATELNDRGVTTPRGVEWNVDSVKYHLNRMGITKRNNMKQRVSNSSTETVSIPVYNGTATNFLSSTDETVRIIREIATSTLSAQTRAAAITAILR